jgi:nitroreductase
LEKILEAGRLAPSAKNWQPWDFVLVTDRKQLRLAGGDGPARRSRNDSAPT